MPYIDFSLTTDQEITKESLRETVPRSLLSPDLKLGKDHRTWNKKQLRALKVVLCNIIRYGENRSCTFLYSRKKESIPKSINPFSIGYRSLFFVIDSLIQARVLSGKKAKPRTKGDNPALLSEFTVTPQVLQLAHSLGLSRKSIKSQSKQHVRLRELITKRVMDYEENGYTRHTETLMKDYCGFLNKQQIILSTKNYETDGVSYYGSFGEEIHLKRNYSNYQLRYHEVLKRFRNNGCDPNFLLGGRSGTLWHSAKREDRLFILINGQESRKVDFPCSHINLCYRQEQNQWYQTATYKELVAQGRDHEDAYIVSPSLPRDIVKKMVELMLNVKGRSAVSNVFNKWLKQKNSKKDRNASSKLVRDYYQAGYSNIEIMDLIERKHESIKSYFYKGKLAGQILQWEEANLIHHIAHTLQEKFGFPVLTVYDELIFEEQHLPLVKRLMFTLGDCEICAHYSLMSQIKQL